MSSPTSRFLAVALRSLRVDSKDPQTREASVKTEQNTLEGIAESSLAFGATTAFEAHGTLGNIVWVDITGCAHLFDGESALAQKLAARIRKLGLGSRIVIADGPYVAAAAARYLPKSARGPIIVSPGKNGEIMRALPIRALPLDDSTARWLENLGLKCVADLARLPKAAVTTRLGADAARVMALLAGDDRTRPKSYVPPDIPEDRAELEYGIDTTEALVFVTKRLSDGIAARLTGRGMAAARLELILSIDRKADATQKDLPKAITIDVALPVPLSRDKDLLAVLRARLESFVIPAPILAVTLRAPKLAVKGAMPLDMFEPETNAERALPRLVAELTQDLGGEQVGLLALVDTWVPEARSRLVPFDLHAKTSWISGPHSESLSDSHSNSFSDSPEPARILPRAQPCPEYSSLKKIARVQAVEWWRRGVGARSYCAAWVPSLGASAWIVIDEATGEKSLIGWWE